jgi:hypothetical protein
VFHTKYEEAKIAYVNAEKQLKSIEPDAIYKTLEKGRNDNTSETFDDYHDMSIGKQVESHDIKIIKIDCNFIIPIQRLHRS